MNEFNFCYIELTGKRSYYKKETNFIVQNPKTEVYFLFNINNENKNILIDKFSPSEIKTYF